MNDYTVCENSFAGLKPIYRTSNEEEIRDFVRANAGRFALSDRAADIGFVLLRGDEKIDWRSFAV